MLPANINAIQVENETPALPAPVVNLNEENEIVLEVNNNNLYETISKNKLRQLEKDAKNW